MHEQIYLQNDNDGDSTMTTVYRAASKMAHVNYDGHNKKKRMTEVDIDTDSDDDDDSTMLARR